MENELSLEVLELLQLRKEMPDKLGTPKTGSRVDVKDKLYLILNQVKH